MRDRNVQTSPEAFHDLWDRLNRTAPKTKFVKVERDTLRDLLIDHAALYSEAFPETDWKYKT